MRGALRPDDKGTTSAARNPWTFALPPHILAVDGADRRRSAVEATMTCDTDGASSRRDLVELEGGRQWIGDGPCPAWVGPAF